MLKNKDLQEIGSRLGIHKLGVATAGKLQADPLNAWLNRGYQGQMSYMERNQEKRLDPSELLIGARSVISVFVNYHQAESVPELEGVISKYARGTDYHPILKDLLHELARELFPDNIQELSRKQRALVYRIFVDSAPVMEKQWAVAAGIGWQGKHSNIITREFGSWGFLGEIVTTEVFDHYDDPVADHCGTCTACIDACPTQAIVEPYMVDGSKCISYATIELKPEEVIPENIRTKLGEWIFGCDICQDVCPWNRFAKPSEIEAFAPGEGLQAGVVPDFHTLDETAFNQAYKASPLRRPGLKGMRRNQQKNLSI
ncbi:MAG: tRNA epoxyqueuosine(34) reductase QueG [Candidatus Marinimicrobia bacterium]|nr:tRNA epoxyqueuosine(34) reductase QueG [Candidatus Neomarinimicrobiota bacterium]